MVEQDMGVGMVEETQDQRILRMHPNLRGIVESDPDFASWLRAVPTVLIDGQVFYVEGGDQLRDAAQIMLGWVRAHRPDLLMQLCGRGER